MSIGSYVIDDPLAVMFTPQRRSFAIQITLFDRQRASHPHHGRKLIIGQAKHVPDDNPERDNFVPCPADIEKLENFRKAFPTTERIQ
ncbi:MAG: hypothetical protein WA704_04180 [Pseudolabrys sp.]